MKKGKIYTTVENIDDSSSNRENKIALREFRFF